MKRLKFSLEEIDRDQNEYGRMLETGRLKTNKMPVQCCEDCGLWMLLAEYPSTHKTWICKVCQGFKKDPEMHGKADVGYGEYTTALAELDVEKKNVYQDYLNKLADIKERRKKLVAEQYAKYGKR